MLSIAFGIILALIGWNILTKTNLIHNLWVIVKRLLILGLALLLFYHFPVWGMALVIFVPAIIAIYLLMLHFIGVTKLNGSGVKSFRLNGITKATIPTSSKDPEESL